ncbi:Cell wall-associated hydrolase, NlpC family [Micromonospora pattaloongensis]|uniref:Cell wall-associated hydrolase, NlpC family n=1 Tax=Micromonospora pattaloongensis TaxID=405436 RepID=A0A1H3I0N9_9ACTN|nr:C40 family peptidase [Micromonospora pattaloongensis]SDY21286.1 Cell wall-associated hydrolase, NlpC family [Micromonospora pattaloongensis]
MATHAPRRSRRPFSGRWRSASRPRHLILAAALAAVAVLLAGAPAHAEPSVAEIEKQIDAAWQKLEPVIERHNATRQQLAAKRKQADALDKKIRPLQIRVDSAMAKVSGLAARSYKSGNTAAINAVLSSGSPTTFADQLELLDRFARRQASDVRAVVELKDRYTATKAPLDALVTQLTRAEADLARKKAGIDREIKRLQALRLKAYGSGGGIGSLRPAPCPATYPGGAAGTAVRFACAQIGKPYVWAAEGPDGYDCSGLTLAAWRQAGVQLPHNAAAQMEATTPVGRAELRPGDLVFYYADVHHVGMYVGNGWIVHASQTGVPIKMAKVDASPISGYGRPG